MIIQFILTGILLCTLFFALLRREKAPLIALLIILFSCGGILLVIIPSIAQALATKVGISRGVDLVTYLFMAIMLMVILDIYLRIQAMLEILTAVVRHTSLLEAQRSDLSNNS